MWLKAQTKQGALRSAGLLLTVTDLQMLLGWTRASDNRRDEFVLYLDRSKEWVRNREKEGKTAVEKTDKIKSLRIKSIWNKHVTEVIQTSKEPDNEKSEVQEWKRRDWGSSREHVTCLVFVWPASEGAPGLVLLLLVKPEGGKNRGQTTYSNEIQSKTIRMFSQGQECLENQLICSDKHRLRHQFVRLFAFAEINNRHLLLGRKKCFVTLTWLETRKTYDFLPAFWTWQEKTNYVDNFSKRKCFFLEVNKWNF